MLASMNGGLWRRLSCGLFKLLSGDFPLKFVLNSYPDTATFCLSKTVMLLLSLRLVNFKTHSNALTGPFPI